MPLMQSGSKKAFKKNVETEMNANPSPKDRAQNLAIAYAVKRRNAKKMASGGMVPEEDMGRNHDEIVSQHSVDNEDLDPTYEPEHSAKNAVLKEMDFSKKAQEHEDLAHPVEPMESASPAEDDLPHGMLSQGSIAKRIMQKRLALARGGDGIERHYAEGGVVDEMGLQDQEVDPDMFLTHNMEEIPMEHKTHLDDLDMESKSERRKRMVSGLMDKIRARHMGK